MHWTGYAGIAAMGLMGLMGMMSSAWADNHWYYQDGSAWAHLSGSRDADKAIIVRVPGLVIRGATVDGEHVIVNGHPDSLAATLFGKPVTLQWGTPPNPAKPFAPPIANLVNTSPIPALTTGSAATHTARPAAGDGHSGAVPLWQIKQSDTRLADTFSRWARESQGQFQVLWDARIHVLVEADAQLPGSGLDAIAKTLQSVHAHAGQAPLYACVYDSNTPPLVRISEQGCPVDAKGAP